MKGRLLCGLGLLAITAIAVAAEQKVLIPEPGRGPSQLVSVEDMAALRRIDALSLSPDGQRFAMLVRQGDAAANVHRRGWFVGNTRGGALTPIGDGGETRLAAISTTNKYTGDLFAEPAVQWSSDGHWIAYTLERHGEIQLWRSKADGSVQEQLTHNGSDVYDLAWSDDGKSIHFSVGTPRADIDARVAAMERNGYHYDTELFGFADFMTVRPKLIRPDTVRTVWTVSTANREERLANDAERSVFERARAKKTGGSMPGLPAGTGGVFAFAERNDGAQAWSARQHEKSYLFQVHALLPGSSTPVPCQAAECVGFIDRVWWRKDGDVIFLRREVAGGWAGFYAWSPAIGTVSRVLQLRDSLKHCNRATEDRLICARQAIDRPSHVASIDFKSGAVGIVADVNPEFRNRRLGKSEAFEWDTPKFKWNEPGGQLQGMYPARAYGYILYPPDFDPKRKYPVFISPYTIDGFDSGTNQEYALHALTARGFVVLRTEFPLFSMDIATRVGPDYLTVLYSAELGFPHLSMLGESTFKALDTVLARGFVDESRVGIGGLSHGAFVPLFMLQKHDRIAAISVSGGGWDPMAYYGLAPAGRLPGYVWPKPVGEQAWKYWDQLDPAANVAAFEAPLLMNVSANETYGVIRLLRHMEEARKPYDAYVFPRENHVKWQPAHLLAIMRRNVDWFQFWLQSHEDPDPAKAEQYRRWHELKKLHEAGS